MNRHDEPVAQAGIDTGKFTDADPVKVRIPGFTVPLDIVAE
jgi:hypothetical protein